MKATDCTDVKETDIVKEKKFCASTAWTLKEYLSKVKRQYLGQKIVLCRKQMYLSLYKKSKPVLYLSLSLTFIITHVKKNPMGICTHHIVCERLYFPLLSPSHSLSIFFQPILSFVLKFHTLLPTRID